MILDHIGIAVRSLEQGIRHWENFFGYQKNSDVIPDTRQKVRVLFLSKPDSLTVKLLEPSEPTSPVFAFARKGGGLHHLSFRCESISRAVETLQLKGARLIVPPEPGPAFNNRPIAFLLADHLNIELIDTEEKRDGHLFPVVSECEIG
jgi:methylmalonyl-CoA/ethylmalonyl-CoA epimerase